MSNEEIQEPEDLGVKVGSKAEKFWTDFKNKTEEDTQNLYYQLEANEVLLAHAEKRIEEEKEKFK